MIRRRNPAEIFCGTREARLKRRRASDSAYARLPPVERVGWAEPRACCRETPSRTPRNRRFCRGAAVLKEQPPELAGAGTRVAVRAVWGASPPNAAAVQCDGQWGWWAGHGLATSNALRAVMVAV